MAREGGLSMDEYRYLQRLLPSSGCLSLRKPTTQTYCIKGQPPNIYALDIVAAKAGPNLDQLNPGDSSDVSRSTGANKELQCNGHGTWDLSCTLNGCVVCLTTGSDLRYIG